MSQNDDILKKNRQMCLKSQVVKNPVKSRVSRYFQRWCQKTLWETTERFDTITGGSEMNELWNKYYAEYIQKHKSDGKDVFQLTNEAINYCMEKLRLGSVTETR